MSNDQEPVLAASRLQPGPASCINPTRSKMFVRDMFNETARHYDLANQIFSLGSGGWYRRACLHWAGLRPGMQAVDVAVGTGLLAREMIALTGDARAVVGLDVSESMLAIARFKLKIPLIQAAAEALPLASASADFLAMGYALRHIADLRAALAEALRVLRPGGTVLLLEISAPRRRFAQFLAAIYIGRIVPLVSLATTRDPGARTLMRYHWDTIVNYMPPEAVQAALRTSGFENVDCWSELDLFHCHVGSKAFEGAAMPAVNRSKSARKNFFFSREVNLASG
jgi:demethylmenaquinone methyltransferase/2-methoxy-6-polyprenyl-1,4-benzoquinol methylase